jgi:hypothetical protein
MAHPVFIPTLKEKVYGEEIRNLVGKGKVFGDIGLEIECEGNKFYKSGSKLEPYWSYHDDHSLRGEDNAEYVLSNPILFDAVPEALKSLWKIFKDFGTELDESNRTSVHVHLNVGLWNVNRLASFTAMWFALEEILSEWAGDHRVGNLFCLRAKDAPNIIQTLKRFIRNDGDVTLHEGLHYAGLNSQALVKFGSLENRYLRGATDPQLILDWVAINRRLYEFSEQFPDPREVCNSFSYGGPMFFIRNILGDTYDIVRNGIDWNDDQISDSLYEGIRMAQDICFCRDWSVFVPVVNQEDPFGRPKKKLGNVASTYGMSEAELQSLLSNVPVYTPLSAPAPAPHFYQQKVTSQPPATDQANEWFSIPDLSEEYPTTSNYDPDED